MDVLIIGNGFDLAHELKTSYKNFLSCDYCNKLSRAELTNGEPTDKKEFRENNLWLKHFITRQKLLGDNWIDLETEIYNVIKNIKEIPAISGGGLATKSCPQILSVRKNATSFDFNNIKDYLSQPSQESNVGIKGYTTDIQTNYVSKFYVYIKTPKGFINFLYDQLRDFTKTFEKYLIENVLSALDEQSKYQLSLKAVGVQQGSKDVRVLSFNYTDTCERLYQHKFNTYCELNIKPIYVHGKVNNADSCNLVLGTRSFDNNTKTNSLSGPIPIDFNIFKKHNQRHRYETIEAYQDLLKELTNTQKIYKPTFHVIGHSLDKTDHSIFKHIFLANKNAVINIYYHDEEAQEKNNITDIIGEEEVMTKVRLIYQHDENRGLLKEVSSS